MTNKKNRQLYLKDLVKNCSKEFYAWNKNNFSILDLTKYNVEPERPETRSSGLCFIYNK